MVIVATTACTSSLPSPAPAQARASPPISAGLFSTLPPGSLSPTAGGCGDTIAHDAPAPGGRRDLSSNPWAAADPASAGIVAYFWRPAPFLRAVPPAVANLDKILWVSEVATGDPLVITATRDGDPGSAVRMTFRPATDPPGDYPSVMALPAPGCWHFALELGTVRASMDLIVGEPV